MRKGIFAALLLALPCAPDAAPVETQRNQALAVQDAFRRVAAGVGPAVVSIDSIRSEAELPFHYADPEDFLRHFFGGEPGEPPAGPKAPRRRRFKGIGSGVITDPRGYVLTNEHVVAGAEGIKIIVRDPEERTYKGEIVGVDPASDLAVIKLEPRRDPYPHAELGDSDKVRIGDWAIAVGSPFGLQQTVTVGVVSALRQSIKVGDRDYSEFFQTDAAINQGNSGGPLLNIEGKVIGINTAIFSPTGVFGGVGFAIPSGEAARIMKELISTGRVVRGWLGVSIAPLNELLARQFKLPDRSGALVNSVVPGTPAAEAGLRRGDVIVEFDGRPVNTPGGFVKMVERTPPGSKAAIRLIRDGRSRELQVAIGERPAEPPEAGEREKPKAGDGGAAWEGARVRDAEDGVSVVSIEAGSAAEEMGLRPGDVVVGIDGRATPDVPAFLKAARGASLRDGVVLDVRRRGRPFYLSFRRE